ncbi:hypothetical protein IM538_09765 [Cytobacillus suaedae]|nr:hypothetical protein IM538_09765 [Cytobacillus suaedae]
MKKWLFIIFLALLTTACTANNPDTASPTHGNNNDEGLTHTFDDGVQTDEEILIEARDHVNINRTTNDNHLSRTEAEELVREHLNIDDNGDIAVFFVREENDNYIIQVNHLEGNSSETFIVDPNTRKITKQRVQK